MDIKKIIVFCLITLSLLILIESKVYSRANVNCVRCGLPINYGPSEDRCPYGGVHTPAEYQFLALSAVNYDRLIFRAAGEPLMIIFPVGTTSWPTGGIKIEGNNYFGLSGNNFSGVYSQLSSSSGTILFDIGNSPSSYIKRITFTGGARWLCKNYDKYAMVHQNILPVLTAANSAPPISVTVSSADGASPGWKIMDNGFGQPNYSWITQTGVDGPHWVKIDLGEGYTRKVTSYKLWPYTVSYRPSEWLFQGSNDDSAWTTLDSRTGIVLSGSTIFDFSNDNAYRYYRLYITAPTGKIELAEMQLLGNATVGITPWNPSILTK